MLPSDLKVKAFKRAKELHVSLGEFIRGSLKMSIFKSARGKIKDSLFLDQVVFTGKVPPNLSKNHDQYLYGAEKL